jgi:hypothetical protein
MTIKVEAMPDQDKGIEPTPWNLEEVSKLLEEQLGRPTKEKALETCQDLFSLIWRRLQPTLGSLTVVAMMQRAVGLTKEYYPLVEYVQVTGDGVNLDVLRQHTEVAEMDRVREALQQLLVHLFEILVTLTGDILVRQLLLEVERRETS